MTNKYNYVNIEGVEMTPELLVRLLKRRFPGCVIWQTGQGAKINSKYIVEIRKKNIAVEVSDENDTFPVTVLDGLFKDIAEIRNGNDVLKNYESFIATLPEGIVQEEVKVKRRIMFLSAPIFTGRIPRLEYSLIMAGATVAVVFALQHYSFFFNGGGGSSVGYILLAVAFLLLWVVSAAGIKRCHDLGEPGFCWFFPKFLFYKMPFVKGSDIPNEYGYPPAGYSGKVGALTREIIRSSSTGKIWFAVWAAVFMSAGVVLVALIKNDNKIVRDKIADFGYMLEAAEAEVQRPEPDIYKIGRIMYEPRYLHKRFPNGKYFEIYCEKSHEIYLTLFKKLAKNPRENGLELSLAAVEIKCIEKIDYFADDKKVYNSLPSIRTEIILKNRKTKTYEVSGVSFTMVFVKGGEVVYKNGNKYPVKDYYIAETEVTEALWAAVMGDTSRNVRPDYPVERVSWYDCQNFIKKINRLTGEKFRLPDTLEYEIAASSWGQESWRLSKENCVLPVKAEKCSYWGLSRMYDNVSEWCSNSGQRTCEYFDENFKQKVYKGPVRFTYGSDYISRSITLINFTMEPEIRSDGIGFRLAR